MSSIQIASVIGWPKNLVSAFAKPGGHEPLCDEQWALRRAAFHEAGHVVVACELGITIVKVEIAPSTATHLFEGRVEFHEKFADVVKKSASLLVAGAVGETFFYLSEASPEYPEGYIDMVLKLSIEVDVFGSRWQQSPIVTQDKKMISVLLDDETGEKALDEVASLAKSFTANPKLVRALYGVAQQIICNQSVSGSAIRQTYEDARTADVTVELENYCSSVAELIGKTADLPSQ